MRRLQQPECLYLGGEEREAVLVVDSQRLAVDECIRDLDDVSIAVFLN